MIVVLHDLFVSDLKQLPDSLLYTRVHDLAIHLRSRRGHPIVTCSRIACLSSQRTSGGSVGLITNLGELSGSTESCRSTEKSIPVMVSGVMLLMVSFNVVQNACVSGDSLE
jgi:hypothetical protein